MPEKHLISVIKKRSLIHFSEATFYTPSPFYKHEIKLPLGILCEAFPFL